MYEPEDDNYKIPKEMLNMSKEEIKKILRKKHEKMLQQPKKKIKQNIKLKNGTIIYF